MRVCHFEDSGVAGLEPLTLTRPAFDLLCGCTTLADKQRRHLGPRQAEWGYLVRPELVEVVREQHPGAPVNDFSWLHDGPLVLVNARWVPPPPPAWDGPDRPCVALVDGEVAWAVLEPRDLGDDWSLVQQSIHRWPLDLPRRDAGGRLVRHLWELVDVNGEQIALDAWLSGPERNWREDGFPAVVGPAGRLLIAPSAQLDPWVVCDTTRGPVVIDEEAQITAFTRIEGPCYIGPGAQVLGARLRAGTSLGPHCRVGGEVEASVLLGYANKYHDGFLGHAYLGAWVNLGAGTSNSDLRNDYGEVAVTVQGRAVRTGRCKVGCFLGDHTKSGLGALLNTGTSVGAFCNLLPTGGLLPRYVPSFTSVWNGSLRENTEIGPLLETAATVLRRRGQSLTPAQRVLYTRLLEQTAMLRRLAIREAEARRLRQLRSA